MLVLRAILEKAAAGGSERTPNEQKIGDYYATCMNVESVGQGGSRSRCNRYWSASQRLQSKDELPEFGRLYGPA